LAFLRSQPILTPSLLPRFFSFSSLLFYRLCFPSIKYLTALSQFCCNVTVALPLQPSLLEFFSFPCLSGFLPASVSGNLQGPLLDLCLFFAYLRRRPFFATVFNSSLIFSLCVQQTPLISPSYYLSQCLPVEASLLLPNSSFVFLDSPSASSSRPVMSSPYYRFTLPCSPQPFHFPFFRSPLILP